MAQANRPQTNPPLPRLSDPLDVAEENLWQAEVHSTSLEAVSRLPKRLRQVIVAAYGLNEEPPYTLVAIGQRYGVSREMARRLRHCEDSLLRGLMAYGIVPTSSTFPGDPPERGVTLSTDSQLVAACSRMRCRYQNPVCFLPPAQRTCAARETGKPGCACDTDACAQRSSTSGVPQLGLVAESRMRIQLTERSSRGILEIG